MGNRIAG